MHDHILKKTPQSNSRSFRYGQHAHTDRNRLQMQSDAMSHPFQRLQRMHGNRNLRRMVAMARQGAGEKGIDPEIGQVIQSKRGGHVPDSSVHTQMESSLDADFGSARVHTDSQANALSRALNARAFTTDQDIFFRQGAYSPDSSGGRELLAHELTHVVQQNGDEVRRKLTIGQPGNHYEQEADLAARVILQRECQPLRKQYHHENSVLVTDLVQRTPVDSLVKAVTKKALKWLSKRPKTISSHVARHTRSIIRTGTHTIFKQGGKKVKSMVKAAISSPDKVIVRLGKLRGKLGKKVIFFKDFGRVIGKNGEKVLKVVVHKKTGEIITAYPVKTIMAIGGMYFFIDEATAAAREEFDRVNKKAERLLESEEPSFWEELALEIITLGLYGGQLNKGEDVWLYVRRQVNLIIANAYNDVVRETEQREKRSLSENERTEIYELVRTAVTMKDALEAIQTQ